MEKNTIKFMRDGKHIQKVDVKHIQKVDVKHIQIFHQPSHIQAVIVTRFTHVHACSSWEYLHLHCLLFCFLWKGEEPLLMKSLEVVSLAFSAGCWRGGQAGDVLAVRWTSRRRAGRAGQVGDALGEQGHSSRRRTQRAGAQGRTRRAGARRPATRPAGRSLEVVLLAFFAGRWRGGQAGDALAEQGQGGRRRGRRAGAWSRWPFSLFAGEEVKRTRCWMC